MRLEASAPTRIDLAGGTIDIWPLYLYHPGAQTLNVAINLRARCTISARSDHRLGIVSEDTGRSLQVDHWSELRDPPALRLLARILHFFKADGVDVVTRGESPVGAGLAGSSALNVASCAALARWCDLPLTPDKILEIARDVEAQAIDVPTGLQDYRPALYGGIAAIELGVGFARRVPLAVDPTELEARLVLAYTGASRHSGINNWEVFKRHIDGDREVIQQFERIRDIASAMRTALERRDWQQAGAHIAAEWECRKRLAPGVTTPAIDSIIHASRAAGAWAAKICGAGGGGCLIAFGDPRRMPAVRSALAAAGARVLDYRIDMEGLMVTERIEPYAPAPA